jgi:hypothetical protein
MEACVVIPLLRRNHSLRYPGGVKALTTDNIVVGEHNINSTKIAPPAATNLLSPIPLLLQSGSPNKAVKTRGPMVDRTILRFIINKENLEF